MLREGIRATRYIVSVTPCMLMRPDANRIAPPHRETRFKNMASLFLLYSYPGALPINHEVYRILERIADQ